MNICNREFLPQVSVPTSVHTNPALSSENKTTRYQLTVPYLFNIRVAIEVGTAIGQDSRYVSAM